MSNLTSCDFYTPASAAAYTHTELARGNEKVEFYDTLYHFSHGVHKRSPSTFGENLKTTLRSDDITPLWPKS